MRVQTHTIWVHRRPITSAIDAAAAQGSDDLSPFIDRMIAQMKYCPSFMVDITPDAEGLLLAGAQRITRTRKQDDGMVLLQTQRGDLWVTSADFQRLMR